MVNSINDEKIGVEVHYGTIYGNDVSSYVLDDIITNGRDLNYEEGLKSLKDDFESHIRIFCEDNYITFENIDIDSLFESFEEEYNNSYESMDSTYLYEKEGYIIEYHTYDNSLIILKSSYVCYAAMCFPNGGGYIRDHGNVLSYCLGLDWYDEDYPCENEPIELEKVI